MHWLSLTLLSQVFLVSYYFFSKRLLNKQGIDPRLYGACLQIATGIISLPFALYQGISFEITSTTLLLLLGMTLVYTIGPSLYYIGLSKVDLSETTILDSSGVLWSVLFGTLLLGEVFTFSKFLGVGLILLAVGIVSFHPKTLSIKLSKYELLLIIAPIFYALGAIFDNRLVSYSDALSYLPITFILAGSVMFATNIHRLHDVGRSTLLNKSFLKTIVVNGVFLFLTYYCVMLAYELGGEVSRMFPIQQLESIIVPLLGILLLKERNRVPQKIIAALVAMLAVMMLR